MRIPFETATAPQLRQYLKEAHGVDRHPNSGTTSLLKLIRDLGETGDTFELSGEPAPEEADPAAPAAAPPNSPAGLAPSEAAHGNSEEAAFTPEKFVGVLMSMGMQETDALELAGLTLAAKAGKDRAGQGTPRQFGPEHDHQYVTIHILHEKGKFGSEPVFVSVNGERLDIPRGVDWPVRVPYYTALLDAIEVKFDQVRTGNAHETKLVPRNTLSYPVELRTPVPYSREVALKIAAEAKATLGGRQTLGQLAAA